MQIEFDEFAPFKMSIFYSEVEGENIIMFEQHVHAECEICINLSGDVSFMVEDTVYEIEPGSVIISRPFEAHHCIYHSKAPHRHFWILFSSNKNEKYFDMFFSRNSGEGNHIILSSESTKRITEICNKLLENSFDEFEKYSLFFDLINIIKYGKNSSSKKTQVRREISDAIIEINERIFENISVAELADKAHMSIRTFERNFSRNIGTTPMHYIKAHRLAISKSYLANEFTVNETAEKCGYCDSSYFVSEFKRFYGITPTEYKKAVKETVI